MTVNDLIKVLQGMSDAGHGDTKAVIYAEISEDCDYINGVCVVTPEDEAPYCKGDWYWPDETVVCIGASLLI